MTGPGYTALAAGLPASVPFVGPEAQERALGRAFRARIGANESVFGPSPAAIAAMQAAAGEVWQYGDPENHDLRTALATRHGVAPDNIVVGEGIDALLGYLVRLLIEPGAPVVTSAGAYPTFNFHVAGYGGRLETVPYAGDAEDPEALIGKARETDARLIYFCNPDNPMGSWHEAGTVQAMIEAVPDGALLCLDEAYVEFAPEGTAPPIDPQDRRVIRMRTFSKAWGMAGARIGYAIAEAGLASAFNKIRNHFGVNRIAQAGALAALSDTGWLAALRTRVRDSLARIARIGAENGLKPLPTATNFITLDAGGDGARARALVAALAERGVFVRMPFVAPQDRCIRISAGRPADLDALAEALPDALAAIE
ncbi:MAG: pyridoxal phosphate-dependent aminotransferase [Alphaproteobacteria bacterium]|nr:MAG: pyridoxal phosphate-dependent aminotransferase [Alphaproteobacteria bacterium]